MKNSEVKTKFYDLADKVISRDVFEDKAKGKLLEQGIESLNQYGYFPYVSSVKTKILVVEEE